ncbi:UGT80A2 [Symbiodinium sp. CCMP2456]|nr:UGT80A2 [Symbiodinium sp. CCMP2456]
MSGRPVVAIICMGSAGDLVPYLALAHEIREKRHGSVLVLTSEAHREMVTAKGMLFENLGSDPVAEMLKNPKKNIDMDALTKDWLRNSLKACQEHRPEGVIFTTMTHLSCSSVCEALQMPFVITHLVPMAPTCEHAPPVFGTADTWFSWTAHLKWRIFETMAFQMHKKAVQTVRADFGLGALSESPILAARRMQVPLIMGYTSALCPRPKDWPETIRITGQWVDSEQEAESSSSQLPQAVSVFLQSAEESGTHVIFVTFGSLLAQCQEIKQFEKLMEALSTAISQAGARALIATKGCEHFAIPQSVQVLQQAGNVLLVPGFLPHGAIMARCLSVICHGGSGTVHTALRAGAVVIVIPGRRGLIDQTFWGARVQRSGVGFGPVCSDMLSVKPRALQSVLEALLQNSESMKSAAKTMAAFMKSEGGAAEAAEISLMHFASHPAPTGSS